MKHIRIGFKLVLVGTILMIVPLMLLAFLAINRSSSALEKLGNDQMISRSREIASVIDRVLTEERRFALVMANDPDVLSAAKTVNEKGVEKAGSIVSEVSHKLSPYEKNALIHWTYEAAIAAAANGEVFASSKDAWKGESIADTEYFKKAMAGETNIGDIFASKVTNMPVVPIASPIRISDNGDVVGVYVSLISINFLTEVISDERIGSTGFAFVIDEKGMMIAHPNPSYIMKVNALQEPGLSVLGKKMNGGASGRSIPSRDRSRRRDTPW